MFEKSVISMTNYIITAKCQVTSACNEVPVQFVPTNIVTDNECDNDSGSQDGSHPEDENTRNIGASPEPAKQWSPLWVQVVLEHHVCDHQGCDQVS